MMPGVVVAAVEVDFAAEVVFVFVVVVVFGELCYRASTSWLMGQLLLQIVVLAAVSAVDVVVEVAVVVPSLLRSQGDDDDHLFHLPHALGSFHHQHRRLDQSLYHDLLVELI